MMSEQEPVRYVGLEQPTLAYHDGQLRPAVGVQSYQVLRANRFESEWAENWGWTYNHAPMLAYWQGQFYLEYLSNPWGEHLPPGHTLLTTSKDGRSWRKPRVVFPVYVVPDGVYHAPGRPRLASGTQAVMHQRMGFYVAPSGRLLVLGFYGICSHPHDAPNDGTGIGRVVREIRADGSWGPIYFIRYNRHAGWNEGNTEYPHYATSEDAGFVQACDALLADRLATLQWWEEDRSADGFYAVKGYKALSYYHLPDGRVVGLWKFAKAAISADEGDTWSPVADIPSLVMAGAKVWGQRTSDGRYAILYNPNPSGTHRWPLVVITGDDGETFDHMALVNGEVPPRRYPGLFKDLGQNYVRGIAEGNGLPPDGDLWVTYSMNKEDIWVSRIPVPIRHRVEAPVEDTFDDLAVGGEVVDWNIYSPLWAPVAVVDTPDGNDKSLCLRDRDPSDYAKAERVFPRSTRVVVALRLLAGQSDHGRLYAELVDGRGRPALGLLLDETGWFQAMEEGGWRRLLPYQANTWYMIRLVIMMGRKLYRMYLGDQVLTEASLWDDQVTSVERLVLRTGPRRSEPSLASDRHAEEPEPASDDPVREAAYYISYVSTDEHASV